MSVTGEVRLLVYCWHIHTSAAAEEIVGRIGRSFTMWSLVERTEWSVGPDVFLRTADATKPQAVRQPETPSHRQHMHAGKHFLIAAMPGSSETNMACSR